MALTKMVHHTAVLRKLAINSGLLIENLDGIPVTGYSESLIESSIDRLQRITDFDGITEALIILIPSRGLWLENLKDEHGKIHEAFIESLRSRNFEFIDLRKEFEKSGNPLRFHFENDGHWNEAGHALAASVIAKHLNNR